MQNSNLLERRIFSREKALLGDDANQFASNNDSAAFVDSDADLLGGGGDDEPVTEFESAYPSLESRNEVCDPIDPEL